jgi:hypothetical protein
VPELGAEFVDLLLAPLPQEQKQRVLYYLPSIIGESESLVIRLNSRRKRASACASRGIYRAFESYPAK